MTQASFDYRSPPSYASEDWIISESNAEAYELIAAPPAQWLSPIIVLYGTSGVGKTHLCHMWQHRVEAQFIDAQALEQRDSAALLGAHRHHVLENVDTLSPAAQTALFHLLNEVKLRGDFMVMTATTHPSKMKCELPDLASRIAACTAIAIASPDDSLLEALLMKQFADKQLIVIPEIIHYIMRRTIRDCSYAKELVERIDTVSLQDKRNITIPLVREVMESM